MKRWAILLSLVAAPVGAQDDLAQRPGRWIAAPQVPVADALRQPGRRPEPRPVPRPWAVAAADSVAMPTHSGQSGPDAGSERAGDEAWRRRDVPMVSVDIAALGQAAAVAPMAAVLVPLAPGRSRPQPRPTGVLVQPPDPDAAPAPVVARPRPRGPQAQDALHGPGSPWTDPQSAVLLPQRPEMPQRPVLPPPAPHLARAMAPGADAVPVSALPPGTLPDGPEAMRRARQPPAPVAAAMAAVLVAPPAPLAARMLLPGGPAAPVRDVAPVSPEAPIPLPEPQPQAVARVIDAAMSCWRRADLSPEARWAEIAVAVALDENDRPVEASIRLTGFRGGVVSGAAADAYRAAHGAVSACAAASGARPATEAATLIFDRSGIRQR